MHVPWLVAWLSAWAVACTASVQQLEGFTNTFLGYSVGCLPGLLNAQRPWTNCKFLPVIFLKSNRACVFLGCANQPKRDDSPNQGTFTVFSKKHPRCSFFKNCRQGDFLDSVFLGWANPAEKFLGCYQTGVPWLREPTVDLLWLPSRNLLRLSS